MRNVVTVSKSNEINQFIIENHETLTQGEIGMLFNVTTKSINCRVSRLREKGLLSKVAKSTNKIAKEIAKAKKVNLSKSEIQAFIVDNHKKMDNKEIAKKLGLTLNVIRANYATLKRFNRLESKTTKVNKTGNSYSNHKGENKERARVKMVNHITNSGVTGTIPTLPNEAWTIEQMINKINPNNNFVGVESNPKTFKIMKSTLRKLKATGIVGSVHSGMINEVIYGKIEDTYAHMILDYCGNLATITKEIEYAIQNDIVKVGGVMAITFAKPIRGTDKESMKLKGLASANNSDDRCDSDRATEAYFHKITGWNYEVSEFFYYQDTYPMTLVIIKRIK
jgi:predicted DNA-binding transcriptional regulator